MFEFPTCWNKNRRSGTRHPLRGNGGRGALCASPRILSVSSFASRSLLNWLLQTCIAAHPRACIWTMPIQQTTINEHGKGAARRWRASRRYSFDMSTKVAPGPLNILPYKCLNWDTAPHSIRDAIASFASNAIRGLGFSLRDPKS